MKIFSSTLCYTEREVFRKNIFCEVEIEKKNKYHAQPFAKTALVTV